MPSIESVTRTISEQSTESSSSGSGEAAFKTHLGEVTGSDSSLTLLIPKQDLSKSPKSFPESTGGHAPNVLKKLPPARPDTSNYKQRMTRAEPYKSIDPETGAPIFNVDERKPSLASRIVNQVAETRAGDRPVSRIDKGIAAGKVGVSAMARGHFPNKSGIARAFSKKPE
jgi:hypothetical protein